MTRNISTKIHKARKDHVDDSSDFIINAMDIIRHGYMDGGKHIKLTFTELRSIAKLRANRWKIKKGQLYERQYNIQDGSLFTFKTLPEIGKICTKHNFYDE